MQLPTILLVAATFSCASLSQEAVDSAALTATLADDLPPAREGLALPQFESDGVTLRDLLNDFARVTDQHLVMSESTRSAMQQTPVVVGVQAEIPPDEVYAFVEGLLVFHGFYTGQLKGGTRPLLGVYSGREVGMAPRKAILEADLERYSGHPAFLIQTVVELPNLDVRQLTTSMRAMLRDTNSQSILAVGDHGVALAGTGLYVGEVAKVMRETNAQAQAASDRRRDGQQPASGETPGTDDQD